MHSIESIPNLESCQQFIEKNHLNLQPHELSAKVNQLANDFLKQFRERKNLSYKLEENPPICRFEAGEIVGDGAGWDRLIQNALATYGITFECTPLEHIKSSAQKHIFGMSYPQGRIFKISLTSELNNPNIFGNLPTLLPTQFSVAPQSMDSTALTPIETPKDLPETTIKPMTSATLIDSAESLAYQKKLYNYLRDSAKDTIRDEVKDEKTRMGIIQELEQNIDAFVEMILKESVTVSSRRFETKIYANGKDELQKILEYKFKQKGYAAELISDGGQVINKNITHIFGSALFDKTYGYKLKCVKL